MLPDHVRTGIPNDIPGSVDALSDEQVNPQATQGSMAFRTGMGAPNYSGPHLLETDLH